MNLREIENSVDIKASKQQIEDSTEYWICTAHTTCSSDAMCNHIEKHIHNSVCDLGCPYNKSGTNMNQHV